MADILIFDKGGRKERIKLVKNKKAPKDFFQSIDYLKSKNFDIEHLTSSINYKGNLVFFFGKYIEKLFCRLTNVGLRPLQVHYFRKKIIV